VPISDLTIKTIQDAVKPVLVTVEGVEYSSHALHDLRRNEPTVEILSVAGLAGLVEFIYSHPLKERFPERAPYVLHIKSFDKVNLCSHPFGYFRQREYFAQAKAPWPDGLQFGRYIESEVFVVQLMSLFRQSDTRDQIIRLLASITSEAVSSHDDDGAVQTVTVKRGIRLKETGVIPNPVTLAPFRTFGEIEQPASLFVFRARTGDPMPECALFEADGGRWKLEAIDRVKAWLNDALKAQIERGEVQLIG